MTERRVHRPARPAAGLLPWQSLFLAFVLGVLALRFSAPSLGALAVLLLADATLRGRAHRLPLLAFAVCFAFGYGYAAQRAPAPAPVPAWMETRRPVGLSAVVDRAEPLSDHRLRVVLRDLRCRVDGEEVALPGELAWNWRYPDTAPEPGQTLDVAAFRVVPVRSFGNPGSWDYAWYWRRQGVLWRGWPSGNAVLAWGAPPNGPLHALKHRLRAGVAAGVPDTPGGGMVRALATGDRSALGDDLLDMTRSAGLAHTLALSGLHVGFVAAIGFGLAWLVGRLWPGLLLTVPRPKLGVLLAAPLVLGYAWLGQPSASLLRAAVMFGAWGVLLWQGRSRVLLDGLFFALAAIILVAPLSVYDLSLEMSATAVAGIGLLLPRLNRLPGTGGRGWLRPLRWAWGVLAVSLSAILALLPLTTWYFGSFSPDFLLNLLWLPVLGCAVMPLSLAGMALSALPGTAPAGGALLHLAAACADGLIAFLGAASSAGLTPVLAALRPLWPEMLGFALLLVLAAVGRARRDVRLGLAGLGLLLLAAPHLWVMGQDSRDRVTLTLLDVGQGQSALIAAPGGRRWLVDGGGGFARFDLGEAVVGPALAWGRPPRIEGVFMSHPDVDHSHGLPFILSRFRTNAFYTNGMLPRGLTGERMARVLAGRGIVPEPLAAGDSVRLDGDTVLDVLHPAPDFGSARANERSLVLRLVRRGKGLALLPGDVEREGEGAFLAPGGNVSAEVLVLPHHGSRTSRSPELYRRVAPEAALCSTGYLNRYGFPHAEVMGSVGAPVCDTATHGAVSAVWDADNRLTLRVFRP
ncbi:DNA internalization-related competence protein ComEC/Rec2 [Pseudodesulfovibrio sp.]|uniref:DNA internalization-related competence protein ComEC/Rec2 n=1 Tax=Pseudodesulfovibrio sp. TaxID=2035812 RepID=UPI00262B2DBE|nr:DNA internalization-related competence protein ComEC/Rec2 [Pseudodesulfovibrio sp.]MDD3311256.1 DNA internalization-related competence protein ComEC/Rec2 [Pseudodesulfovibrio sp.]